MRRSCALCLQRRRCSRQLEAGRGTEAPCAGMYVTPSALWFWDVSPTIIRQGFLGSHGRGGAAFQSRAVSNRGCPSCFGWSEAALLLDLVGGAPVPALNPMVEPRCPTPNTEAPDQSVDSPPPAVLHWLQGTPGLADTPSLRTCLGLSHPEGL